MEPEDSKISAPAAADARDGPEEEREGLVQNDALSGVGDVGGLKSAPRPCCGECGESVEEVHESLNRSCPGCDAAMHSCCGKAIGDPEHSTFRLCVSCESSNYQSGGETVREGPSHHQKKKSVRLNSAPTVSRLDPYELTVNYGEGGGLIHTNESFGGVSRRSLRGSRDSADKKPVVSHLMNQSSKNNPLHTLPPRRPSKPRLHNADDPRVTPPADAKVSVVGNSYSLYLLVGVFILLFGFIAFEADVDVFSLFRKSTSSHSSSNVASANDTVVSISDQLRDWQDAWYIDVTSDSFLRTVHAGEDLRNKLVQFRPEFTKTTQDSFSNMCGKYRFTNSKFPTASILVGPVYSGFAKHLLSMTVHSILARTPPELVKEILVIHGKGDLDENDEDLALELTELEKLLPDVVKIYHAGSSVGRFRSRNIAIRQTTADVLVILDPYVEVWSSDWLQQLLLPIMENPRTISAPLAHGMTLTRELVDGEEDDLALGGYWVMMDDHFHLSRRSTRFKQKERPSTWRPYASPFFDGPIFAVRRDEFLNLGGFDEGMVFNDGESVELSLRYWMCRGRVMLVPCARVGSIPLTADFGLPKMSARQREINGLRHGGNWEFYGHVLKDDHSKLAVRNYLRITRIWLGESKFKEQIYKSAFGSSTKLPREFRQYEDNMEDDDGDIHRLEDVRTTLQCQNLAWFDKHVLMTTLASHHPWYESIHGTKKDRKNSKGGTNEITKQVDPKENDGKTIGVIEDTDNNDSDGEAGDAKEEEMPENTGKSTRTEEVDEKDNKGLSNRDANKDGEGETAADTENMEGTHSITRVDVKENTADTSTKKSDRNERTNHDKAEKKGNNKGKHSRVL